MSLTWKILKTRSAPFKTSGGESLQGRPHASVTSSAFIADPGDRRHPDRQAGGGPDRPEHLVGAAIAAGTASMCSGIVAGDSGEWYVVLGYQLSAFYRFT